MPTGQIANLLSAVKITGRIRLSECAVTLEDMAKTGRLGPAIKTVIECDTDRYYRLMDKLRTVQTDGKTNGPDVDPGIFLSVEILLLYYDEIKNDTYHVSSQYICGLQRLAQPNVFILPSNFGIISMVRI